MHYHSQGWRKYFFIFERERILSFGKEAFNDFYIITIFIISVFVN